MSATSNPTATISAPEGANEIQGGPPDGAKKRRKRVITEARKTQNRIAQQAYRKSAEFCQSGDLLVSPQAPVPSNGPFELKQRQANDREIEQRS